MAVVIVALGIPVFIWARKQNDPKSRAFTKGEAMLAGLLLIISIWAIYAFARGIVSMN